jgi:hypothetical protein
LRERAGSRLKDLDVLRDCLVELHGCLSVPLAPAACCRRSSRACRTE